MVWRDWAIPLAIGVVALIALLFFAMRGDDGGGGPSGNNGGAGPQATADGLIYPFATGANTTGGSATVLVISQKSRETGFNGSTGIDWKTKYVGYDETESGDIVCIRAPCDLLVGPQYHHKVPPGPRFGVGGYNASRMTIYGFETDGDLIASNAGVGPFDKATFYQKLTGGIWYLGKGETPDGMEEVPKEAKAFVNQARAKLVGLPPGGVATTTAKIDFVGTVYITVRLDALYYAP